MWYVQHVGNCDSASTLTASVYREQIINSILEGLQNNVLVLIACGYVSFMDKLSVLQRN